MTEERAEGKMDGVGDFVERVKSVYKDLDLPEGAAFLVEEGHVYESLSDIQSTIIDSQQATTMEGYPMFTIMLDEEKEFKVFLKTAPAGLSEEEQIVKRLTDKDCQVIVDTFRRYPHVCVCF